jgi:hypothetical protein
VLGVLWVGAECGRLVQLDGVLLLAKRKGFCARALNLFEPGPTYQPMFDMVLSRRRRSWEWRVADSSGQTILRGREPERTKARYQAQRAVFLLLMAARTCELDREDKL